MKSTIKRERVTTIAMVAGGEKKLTKVVYNGMLKEWVGSGWIDLRRATMSDKAKYPRVVP